MLNIWDAAGDGDVHNLAHMFVRDLQVCVLVYSIDSDISYNNLNEWLDHVLGLNDECVVFLVACKSDMVERRAVP